MKRIIISLAMIAAVGAVVIGATTAFFSDTEKSTGNTFSVGTIDISVDDENPWNSSWENYLDKPTQTNYLNFVIQNVGENPAKVWKKLTNVINGPGEATYPVGNAVCSSEPEYEEGGGFAGNYVERDNLSAFMIYDMVVCKDLTGTDCPLIDDGYGNVKKPDLDSQKWTVLISEDDQVRVDNVVDTWIKLSDDLEPGQRLVVSQSYHLMTWDDSGQPLITNWAQGDEMTFDIELDARQLDAPAPGTFEENNVVKATANLVAKNTSTWDPISGGASGTLTYEVEGNNFNYDFSATGLVADGNYQLIYYPDPWASPKTVVLIGGALAAAGGNVSGSGSVDLNMDLPNLTDANYPVGAKVWLVPTASLSGNQLSWTNLSQFLFDSTLVNYADLDD